MALDMYLEARRYLPPSSEELAPVRQAIGRAIGYTPPTERPGHDATLMEITGVTVRVGYWRDAYPLHQWYVSNVLESYDDPRAAYVSPEVLAELEERLDRVRDDPGCASEHFVSTDGQPMAESDIDTTLRIVAQATALQESGWDIYYRASW